MNKAVLSYKYPEYAARLRSLGYETIPTENVSCFISYEQDHADMQCLITDDTAFVLDCCRKLSDRLYKTYKIVSCGKNIGGKYPKNVCINALVTGGYLVGRLTSLDIKLKEYCSNKGYKLINTHQGYAKCSCAVVSDKAVITADEGMIKALRDTDIAVLKIGQESIRLEGAEYGFIGGASGYDKNSKTLYFCGNINYHPDSDRIKEFCDKYGTKIVNLNDSILTDIGGIIYC